MDQPAGTELRLRVKSERVSFMLGVEQDSGNHCSITSHQLSLYPYHAREQGCGAALIFCGSGSSSFLNADPDPAALKLRIRIQFNFFGSKLTL